MLVNEGNFASDEAEPMLGNQPAVTQHIVPTVAPGKTTTTSKLGGSPTAGVTKGVRKLQAANNQIAMLMATVLPNATLQIEIPQATLKALRSAEREGRSAMALLNGRDDDLAAANLLNTYVEARITFENYQAMAAPFIDKIKDETPEASIDPFSIHLEGKAGGAEQQAPRHPAGMSCDREPAGPGCHYSSSERLKVYTDLGARVALAHENLRAAAEQASLEQTLRHETGWGPIAETLFSALSFGVTAGLTKAAVLLGQRFAKAAPAVSPTAFYDDPKPAIEKDKIVGIWTHAARGIRYAARDAVTGIPADAHGKIKFLQLFTDQMGRLSQRVKENVTADLNDEELDVLIESYDVSYHSQAYYSEQIAGLLQRTEEAGLDQVGTYREFEGITTVAFLRSNGHLRRALVAQNKPALSYFLHWVEEDMGEIAEAFQRGSTGSLEIIDVMPGSMMTPPEKPKTIGKGTVFDGMRGANSNGSFAEELEAWIVMTATAPAMEDKKEVRTSDATPNSTPMEPNWEAAGGSAWEADEDLLSAMGVGQ